MTAGPSTDSATSPDGSNRWQVLGWFVPAAVLLDQATKLGAEAWLAGQEVALVPGLLLLRLAWNQGVFLGLGGDLPPGLRAPLLAALALVAAGFMLYMYRSLASGDREGRRALLLLIAGATGNLVDRLARGEVVDFFHLHDRVAFDWATFNLADVYICVGLALIAVAWIRRGRSSASATRTSGGVKNGFAER